MSTPNIIVIMADDLDDITSLDYMPKTRNLIEDQGIKFNNSFTVYPQCCASRASFLTGRYPHNHGIVGNTSSEFGGFVNFVDTDTLPVVLQDAGYTTALFGKYINGYSDLYIPPGWDRWWGVWGTSYLDYHVNNDGNIQHFQGQSNHLTSKTGSRVCAWIEDNADPDEPFFLFVSPKAPHSPYQPLTQDDGDFSDEPLPQPPNFNEVDVSDKPSFQQVTSQTVSSLRQIYRNRLELLKGLDRIVEDIIETLDLVGILDNTILVFTSDNGWFNGEHRYTGKKFMYEESIRVPLLICGPGIPIAEVRNQLVSNIDLTATILEWAGITSSLTLDGSSLVPIIEDDNALWREGLLIEGVSGDLDTTVAPDEGRFKMIRTADYSYAQHKVDATTIIEELYDLNSDAYQLVNVAGDTNYNGIKNQLASDLEDLVNGTQ